MYKKNISNYEELSDVNFIIIDLNKIFIQLIITFRSSIQLTNNLNNGQLTSKFRGFITHHIDGLDAISILKTC